MSNHPKCKKKKRGKSKQYSHATQEGLFTNVVGEHLQDGSTLCIDIRSVNSVCVVLLQRIRTAVADGIEDLKESSVNTQLTTKREGADEPGSPCWSLFRWLVAVRESMSMLTDLGMAFRWDGKNAKHRAPKRERGGR